MAITSEMVKELRAATGAGVLDCKKALEEAKGDFDKAIQYLLEKGQADARRKQGRETREGLIESYVHPGNRVAALVEVNCETDFVARTDEFRQLAHDLAMQVVAARPLYISPEDIPPEVLEEEKRVYRAQAAATGKPEHILDKIVEGKLKKFYDEVCLLRQPFIKDPEITVQELITRSIAKLGENIVVRRFVRFEMGETT
ncbi:MAG: translation elongation factor Ts [Anaerolineae bacterium]